MKTLTLMVTLTATAFAAPDLSKAPPIPARAKWAPPPFEEAVTKTGAKLAVLPRRGLPLVHLVVTIPAGSALDSAGKSGLAQAVAKMLEEGGAGSRSPAQLKEALDDLGSELAIECDAAGVRLAIAVVSSRLPRAIALLGDILARPRFDAAEWPAVRERLIADALTLRANPRVVAEEVFMRAVYGDHPYSRPALGRKADLEKLALDELRAFHARHYGPRTLTWLLFGDANLAEARTQIDAALAGWSGTAQPPPDPPAPPAPSPRVVIVDRPGTPQAAVHLGHVALGWSSPELPAARVIEMVLGGSFTSRLNQNLREKHGYTYGVRARFEPLPGAGTFWMRGSMKTDVTADAIRETLSELSLRAPITAAEVGKAQALHGNEVVEAYASGQAAVQMFPELALGRQPPGVLARLDAQVQSLDPAQVAKTATGLVHANQLTIVIVGDRKAIEPKLRALTGLGPIEYRDAEGELSK